MAKLFDNVRSISTLTDAFDRVEDNQGGPGWDGQTIEDFALNLEGNLLLLRRELSGGSYKCGPLLRCYVRKDDGGKRALSIPCVRDRVVQTAVALTLAPVLDREFEDFSYAYRRGRSVDQAIRRIIALRDNGYKWIVDADIHRFFDEVSHPKLLQALREVVSDRTLIRLVEDWLKTDVFESGRFLPLAKGVPQGSPLSPLMANLYLDRFDEACKARGSRLVRYADDFVILCKTRPGAQKALETTEESLADLRLKLNPAETQITNFDTGFEFLGVQFLKSLAFKSIYDVETDAPAESPPPAEEAAPNTSRAPPSETVMGRALREALESPEPLASSAIEEEEEELVVEPAAAHPTLRTLYLVKQGCELGRRDERFVVRKDGRTLAEIPALKVDQIMVFGNIGLTTPALQFCLCEDIPVFLLSSRGRYYGVVESMANARVILHRHQFLCHSDADFRLATAREMVRGKISNSRTLLLRLSRRSASEIVKWGASFLDEALDTLDSVADLNELRGWEGAAAARYWACIADGVKEEWGFGSRQRRPPPDPVNSLLSFGYTLLFQNAYSLARSRGLHPYVGFYHDLREGHPALISDLVEEFRAPVVDAAVLAMINRNRIKLDDFHQSQEAAWPCLLTSQARKKVTRSFEKALGRAVAHPDSSGPCDYRRAMLLQCDRLVQAVKSGEPSYRAFLTR